MTKEQFKKNFKVGDKITCDLWQENDHLQFPYSIIVYIKDDEFCIEDEDGLTVCLVDEHDWKHYKEPVKKDLEGLKKWYKLYYDINDEVGDVSLVWRKIRPTDVKRDDDRYMVMYIKEEEAIERGLKI